MLKQFYLIVILVCTSTLAHSQLADSLKSQLLKDWKRSKAYTDEYLNTMPENKFSFRAQDSIRSFAQQMIHLAQGTVSLMNASTGKQIPVIINRQNLEQTVSALTKDSVSYFVNLSYNYAIQAIEAYDMAKSMEHVQHGNLNETRLAWMFKAYEHQAHHCGQMAIYIRLVGLKPPNEKLFGN